MKQTTELDAPSGVGVDALVMRSVDLRGLWNDLYTFTEQAWATEDQRDAAIDVMNAVQDELRSRGDA